MTCPPARGRPGWSRPGSLMVRAWGTAPAEGFHAGLAVEDPAEFTAAAFKDALRSRGVTVAGQRHLAAQVPERHRRLCRRARRAAEAWLAPRRRRWPAPQEGRRLLATHVSVPVAQDITVINKMSQNLHAELLLRLLGKLHGGTAALSREPVWCGSFW